MSRENKQKMKEYKKEKRKNHFNVLKEIKENDKLKSFVTVTKFIKVEVGDSINGLDFDVDTDYDNDDDNDNDDDDSPI